MLGALLCVRCLAGSAPAAPIDLSKGLHIDPSSVDARDRVLAEKIVSLFNEDQLYLEKLGRAKQDATFRAKYRALSIPLSKDPRTKNFYDACLYRQWARDQNAPSLVRRYSAFREATNAEVRGIVTEHGWPTRQQVGDQAGAGFFFLFGHADNANPWRATQLTTIRRVFRHDHLNPRLYAHMVDRVTDLGTGKQRFGTIMGPGKTAGSADLYAPLIDDVKRANHRRTSVGLPSIEDDLGAYKGGAEIGPFMTPLKPNVSWDLPDVYASGAASKAGY